MRPSDDQFREALRAVLARSGLSMRGLSAAMARDPGFVAASLDPTRPSRARPTPEDLLAASDASGIAFVELLEALWGIDRSRLALELTSLGVAGPLAEVLASLDERAREQVIDYARYLAAPSGRKQKDGRST